MVLILLSMLLQGKQHFPESRPLVAGGDLSGCVKRIEQGVWEEYMCAHSMHTCTFFACGTMIIDHMWMREMASACRYRAGYVVDPEILIQVPQRDGQITPYLHFPVCTSMLM